MNNVFDIILRTLISALVLFILAKVMGRKQVGQLNTFDYIIGITIGSIAAEMTINQEIGYWVCIVSMITLAIIGILISYVTTKSIALRRLITGTPIILIEDGKIIEKGLNNARFDVNDLLQESRVNGYFDISEIEYALMEANGRISFLPKSKYVPLTPNDSNIKVPYKGLTSNLIIDGHIMKNNLRNINKKEEWLIARLKNQKIEPKDILLLSCNSKEQFTVYKKDEKLKKGRVLE